MARLFKEEDYATRRGEILDAAERFVYSSGYEQMSVQNLLDALNISKGAFYHYFDSKSALLEALVERLIDRSIELLLPIVQDPHLNALEKYLRFFNTAVRWKTAQKAFLLPLLHTWYADGNTLLRQKLISKGISRIAPLHAAMIKQGSEEGIFHTPNPQETSEVILTIMNGFGEATARLLLSDEPGNILFAKMVKLSAAYIAAMERVLGAPAGSIHFMDEETIKAWTVLQDDPACSPV